MRILFSTLLFMISSSAFAGDLPESAAAPAAAMAQLDGLKGEWTTTVEMKSPEGDWRMQSQERVVIEPILSGLALREKTIERLAGEGFEIETTFSFDQYRNVYRLAAIDDTWGLMDIYEGRVEGETLVVTNIRAETSFPIETGAFNFRLTIPLAGDIRVMTVDQSTDGGANWAEMFRTTYRRAD